MLTSFAFSFFFDAGPLGKSRPGVEVAQCVVCQAAQLSHTIYAEGSSGDARGNFTKRTFMNFLFRVELPDPRSYKLQLLAFHHIWFRLNTDTITKLTMMTAKETG